MSPVAIASRFRAPALALALVCTVLAAGAVAAEPTFVRFETDEGTILMVMYPDIAPHHVANFTHLAGTGFYDGSRFHRIIPGFVIQGGDPNSKDDDPRNDGMGGPDLSDVLTAEEFQLVEQVNELLDAKGYKGVEAKANLKAEFPQEIKHERGTLSMARSRDPDSAGSQFFICVDATPQLDRQYTVFGHVVMGMDVADAIVNGELNPGAGRDYPAVPVAVQKATVVEGVGGLTPAEQTAWTELPANFKNAE